MPHASLPLLSVPVLITTHSPPCIYRQELPTKCFAITLPPFSPSHGLLIYHVDYYRGRKMQKPQWTISIPKKVSGIYIFVYVYIYSGLERQEKNFALTRVFQGYAKISITQENRSAVTAAAYLSTLRLIYLDEKNPCVSDLTIIQNLNKNDVYEIMGK